VLWEKLFNDVEHRTLQVTVLFFGVILKYGVKYCKGCNSWSNENISRWNFQGQLKTPSAVNSEILLKNLSVVQVGDIFWVTLRKVKLSTAVSLNQIYRFLNIIWDEALWSRSGTTYPDILASSKLFLFSMKFKWRKCRNVRSSADVCTLAEMQRCIWKSSQVAADLSRDYNCNSTTIQLRGIAHACFHSTRFDASKTRKPSWR